MEALKKSQKAAIIAKTKKLVLKHHINVAGIDYEAWTRELDQRAPQLLLAENQQFEAGMRELLAWLKTSHTAFFNTAPDALLPQHTLNATLRKVSIGGAWYWMFLDVFKGGAADRAGIAPGRLLRAVDGAAVSLDDVPKFAIGRQYTLTVGGPGPNETENVLVQVPSVKASAAHPPLVPPKTIEHKMLDPGLGYLKIGWFTASAGFRFAKELDAAIADLKNSGCERLIIDLRGNIGGGLGFARLASYLCAGKIAIGQSLTPARLRLGFQRDALPRVPMPSSTLGLMAALTRFLIEDKSLVLLTQGLGPQPFHGNMVVLVNEWTNSAAEMVANFAGENRLATVIGTKTSGTVLGARNFAVGAGYWVRMPVFGWFTSTGSTIEGRGVMPDVEVAIDAELLAKGEDSQLLAAKRLLAGTATVASGALSNVVA